MLSCTGFVSSRRACSHLELPFPRKLTPVPYLKRSRGCDSSRAQLRNDVHSIVCITSRRDYARSGGFYAQCICVGFENCTENCPPPRRPVCKDFTMSQVQWLGAAPQKCDCALSLVTAGIQSEHESHRLPACWCLLCCSRKLYNSSFFQHSSFASIRHQLWSLVLSSVCMLSILSGLTGLYICQTNLFSIGTIGFPYAHLIVLWQE